MKKYFFNSIVFLFCVIAYSQEYVILNTGQKMVNQSMFNKLKLSKDIGSFVINTVSNENIGKAITLTKPEGVYNLSVKIPLNSKLIKAGQPMLISFKAKSLEASLETNESKVNWLFKQTESASPKDVISKSVSLSANWQNYYIPFKAIFDGEISAASLSMQFGYAPQVFEIKDVEVYVFEPTVDYSKLPSTKITYAGSEENAKWRTEAEKRIEEIRKGDFSLYFYLNDKPLSNVDVKINQVKHHFRFGAAVNADDINSNEPYFNTIKKLFNIIVFENDLKAKRWINKKNRAKTITAIDKLRINQILVKGHVLLWPGFNYLPEVYKENKENPNKIEQLLNENYTSILTDTKGKISHWDVLNEAYTNKDISKIMGSDAVLFNAFKIAKELDPNAKRYINEYGIISGGGYNTIKQDWYYNFIKNIDEKTKGAIDGLGMQSHIGTDLTPPTRIVEILNRFSELNKEIAISEYTLDILEDEELRANYTRDFMISTFSCKAVKEFLFWGFYAPTHPKAALVDANFNLTKMGNVYYDLVFNKWTSKFTKTSNSNGMVYDRGFFGEYEFSITHEGKNYQGKFSILPNEVNKLKIKLK